MNTAGIWRRLGAFMIDGVLLGVVGILAGVVFYEDFVRLGGWGRLIGLALVLAYFGLLNSRLGGGQTLGKRLLKIRVVGADGSPLPLPKALLRTVVLAIPWFLNGAPFPADLLASPLIYVLSLAIFGLGGAILYLLFFNRGTRQSLHDLLVGSFVVNADATTAIEKVPLWRTHAMVVGAVLAAAALAPFITSRLASQEPFAALMKVFNALNAEPGIVRATVSEGWTSSGEQDTSYLLINAFLDRPGIEDARLAQRLARVAIANDPTVLDLQIVQVVLIYGYDIGIAAAHRSQAYRYPPKEWITAGQ
jgi:uncharacterized RDD family membrane protein YckC